MKAKTIRMIIIAVCVIELAGFITVDSMFNNSYINLIYIIMTFCGFGLAGSYISDYILKHDMLKDVIGDKLYDILTNDDED